MANALNAIQANIVKYACRYPFKNGIEDLRKIIRYAEIGITFLQRDKLPVTAEGILICLNHFLNKEGDLEVAKCLPCTPHEADRLLRAILREYPADVLAVVHGVMSFDDLNKIPKDKQEVFDTILKRYREILEGHNVLR